MPSVMSAQNSRMRPSERSTSGTKEAAAETNKAHWIRSLKAVSGKDRGRTRAARTKAANNPATAANQTWERLLKTLLGPHSRTDLRSALVTVVILKTKCWSRERKHAPDSHLPVSCFYSIICPKAATPVEDSIESAR